MAVEGPRFAFLFEGQGNQRPGMWLDLYQASPEAREIFDRADQMAIREGLPRITDTCFELDAKKIFWSDRTFILWLYSYHF